MSGTRSPDPGFAGRFFLTVDDVEVGAFTEVSGLAMEVEVEDLQEGGQNGFVHRLPGRVKWPNIVLKRGVIQSDSLFEWFAATSGSGFAGAGNTLERKHGEIALFDGKRNVVRRWEFDGAFPVRWTGPTLAASSNDLAVEELEIAHHGFSSG